MKEAMAVVVVMASITMAWAEDLTITGPLIEGATTIRGAGPPRTDVQLCDQVTGKLLAISGGSTLTVDSRGAFIALLQNPLVAGQAISPQAAGSQCPVPETLPPPVPVSAVADWGRVRATFAVGAVLANDNNFQGKNGTESSLFMDLLVDRNWIWRGISPPPSSDPNASYSLKQRVLFNTSFEARLTSIPESQCVSAGTDTTSNSGAGCAAASDGALATFIGSRKSAMLQRTAYFPILTTRSTTG